MPEESPGHPSLDDMIADATESAAAEARAQAAAEPNVPDHMLVPSPQAVAAAQLAPSYAQGDDEMRRLTGNYRHAEVIFEKAKRELLEHVKTHY